MWEAELMMGGFSGNGLFLEFNPIHSDGFPIYIDTISMDFIVYLVFYGVSGPRSKLLNFNIFLSQKNVFILANSADPANRADTDEMPHCAAFYLCLHC